MSREESARATALPPAESVVGAFGTTVRHEHRIVELGRALAAHHERQWCAEDASRDPGAGDGDLARVKRDIDELNRRRVTLVRQIEDAVDDVVPDAPGAPLHTETLGSVIDRLAIAWVRERHTTTPDERTVAGQQLVDLGGAYDDLVDEVVNQLRRLPRWRVRKDYGENRATSSATLPTPSMDLALGFDANYERPVRVLMESVLQSQPAGSAIRLWLVVDDDVTDEVRQRIRLQIGDRAAVEFLSGTLPDGLPLLGDPSITHVSRAMYLRLLLPGLLPRGVRHVLYLDCDVLCMGSLVPLFDTALQSNVVAAVRDAFVRRFKDGGGLPGLADHHHLDPASDYFNAGVLLIDTEAWRAARVTDRCLDYVRGHQENARYPEQDALNVALYGQWLRLPAVWNHMMPWRLESEVGGDLREAILCHVSGSLKGWHDHYPGSDVRHLYRRLWAQARGEESS